MFDLTSPQSLDSVERYMNLFKEECPVDAQDNIVLVGAKLDDVANRKVSRQEAEEVCRQYGFLGYFETSASSGENVDDAFFSIAARAF